MNETKGKTHAFDLWLLDLALTAVSLEVAYRLRTLFLLGGHTVMPFEVYVPALKFMLPVWAVVLPLLQVYSTPLQPLAPKLRRLGAAVFLAWLLASGMQLVLDPGSSNRLMLLFTLPVNFALLAAYRVLLYRKQHHDLPDASSI